LFTNPSEIDRRVRQILDQAGRTPGFIFNLGHGILPGTPPEHAHAVIRSVRTWSQENLG
jgi:uroporphyrinogen decarboxylase